MTAVECAIEEWKLEKVALYSPVEELVVAAKLSALGRAYSRDVLALYAVTGGMEDGYSDSHLLSLWSLERVVAETGLYTRLYILFADFLCDSQLYCFKYVNEEHSSVCVDYLMARNRSCWPEASRSFSKSSMLIPRDLECSDYSLNPGVIRKSLAV
jgi:hypothetical protein